MPLTFRWLGVTTLPVEATGLRPDALAGLDPAGAARLTVPVGNARAELGELFQVEGHAGDECMEFEGDLVHLRGLGQGMTSGTVVVRGRAGPRLGAAMTGGHIEVDGDAGGWAGAEMRGGTLTIRGNAGEGLGAAFPGSRLGMREGIILVHGSAGPDAGQAMRRGFIAIAGDTGIGLGRAMVAGSIFAWGTTGPRTGAGMKRGTIVLAERPDGDVLPTFAPTGTFRPPFLALYLKNLRARGFPVPEATFSAAWQRYNGDLVEGGHGEILLPPG